MWSDQSRLRGRRCGLAAEGRGGRRRLLRSMWMGDCMCRESARDEVMLVYRCLSGGRTGGRERRMGKRAGSAISIYFVNRI